MVNWTTPGVPEHRPRCGWAPVVVEVIEVEVREGVSRQRLL